MLEISDFEEIRNMDRAIREALGPGILPEYTVEPIPAGVPVQLVYERGTLSRVFTKGDLFGGEDVTANVKTILTVPLSIQSGAGKEPPVRLEVLGTVYVEKDAVREDPASGSIQDIVSASLIGVDVRVTARCPLNMFCHGAEREPELGGEMGVASHFEVMLMLQDWGFRVNKPHIRICSGISEVIHAIGLIEEQRGSAPYEVNGGMVQLNLLAHRSTSETASQRDEVIIYGFKA